MTSLLAGLHFWTSKSMAPQSGLGLGSHTYHDKGTDAGDMYTELRRQWAEGRGVTWTLRNKRPDKLRESVKESEDLLAANRVVEAHWKTPSVCQLLLNNGTLLQYALTPHAGDVDRLLIDRTLVNKVCTPPEMIFDAVISSSGNVIVASFLEKGRLTVVHLPRRNVSAHVAVTSERLEKMSSHGDPKMTSVDLPGPANRRLERHLSMNCANDVVAVWWPTATHDAWPWATLADTQASRSNLLLVPMTTGKIEVVWHTRTDFSPIAVSFSGREAHHLYTLEETAVSASSRSVDICLYEYSNGKAEKVLSKKLELSGALTCHMRNHDEDKLAMGCDNSRLLLYDERRKENDLLSQLLVIGAASVICWHSSDTLLVVANNKGDVQVFDLALTPVLVQLVSENPVQQTSLDTSQFFLTPPRLDFMAWSSNFTGGASSPTVESVTVPSSQEKVLLVFDRGPLCILCIELGVMSRGRLGPLQLLSEYVTHKQLAEATTFLQRMDWNRQPKVCFTGLTLIVDQLLRMPLTADTEKLAEESLGSFLAPSYALVESVQAQYRNRVTNLTRRFFHLLLRYRRFEKAFLLAEDIGARDLFMDIHYLAMEGGERALAEQARHRAETCEVEHLGASLESLEAANVDSDFSGSRDDDAAVDKRLSGSLMNSESEETEDDMIFQPVRGGSGFGSSYSMESTVAATDHYAAELSRQEYIQKGFASTPVLRGYIDDDIHLPQRHHSASEVRGTGSQPSLRHMSPRLQRRGELTGSTETDGSAVKVLHVGLV